MKRRIAAIAPLAVLLLCGVVWARMTTVVVGQTVTAAGGGGTPTLSSATIATTGKTISLVFSEAVSIGAGGNGGVVLTPTHANWNNTAYVATYASGSGSTTLVYNLDRYATSVETGTIAYTQPGNGIEATTGGGDVATFSGTSITNSSTVSVPDIYYKFEDNAANATITATYGSNGSIYSGGAGSDDSQDNNSTTAHKGTYSFEPVDSQVFIGVSATGTSIEDGVFTIQWSYYADATTGFGSGNYVRMFKDTDNDSFCMMSNNGSSTSWLLYSAGTEFTATLDEVNTASWQVIRVVFNTGAGSDRIRVYQGSTETGLTQKYTSGASAVTAPTLTSEGFLMFGNGSANRGIQLRNGKADEVKVWYSAVTP